MTSTSKDKRKDRAYMMWCLDKFPCYVCQIMNIDNWSEQRQFHHLQGAYRQGAAIRDDRVGVVLCWSHHNELHTKGGERNFWSDVGVDPKIMADEMYQEYQERKGK